MKNDMDLRSFGEKFREVFSLPPMTYDYENDAEWLEADKNGVTYNISKPYEKGTLQEWDSSLPEGCNIGISLSFYTTRAMADNNPAIDNHVRDVCTKLASAFNTTVYNHRTWLEPDINQNKLIVFVPNQL